MPSLAELRKQKLAKQKVETPVIDKEEKNSIKNNLMLFEDKKSKAKTSKKQKEPEDISKLTIDELRAYYIVICKKRPKHNSKQDKEFLVNEIINVLNLSKKEV